MFKVTVKGGILYSFDVLFLSTDAGGGWSQEDVRAVPGNARV